MVFIGMIYQYDSTQGSGLIMLSDGDKREFSSDDWTDESVMPAVGQKVSYESNDGLVKIRLASDADMNRPLPDEKKTVDEEDATNFASVKEYQTYFLNKGFEPIKNTQEGTDDEFSMGRFSNGNVETVSMAFIDFQPKLIKKTVLLSSVEDHIKYFTDIGYRLIKDFQEGETRNLILRRYVMDKHGEVIIKQSASKISVTQTVNGKTI